MPTEIALWRVDGQKAKTLRPVPMPSESALEEMIETAPDILGETLLIVGRQVPTAHGGRIDLLAIDGEGVLRVLELKRDRTPRDVLAQLLDYGSWARTLSHTDILDIFNAYRGAEGRSFEAAFEERFEAVAPQELNTGHRLTIVAAELDAATERIVEYLNDFGVPANVVFFRYYDDDGNRYLARSWLIDESRTAPPASGKTVTREPWNGRDWYVSFGDDEVRSWDDAVRYGFVSAGGGSWFSRTLRRLPEGARIFVYIPKRGYVGVAEVAGPATPFAQARFMIGGVEQALQEQDLRGTYRYAGEEADPDLLEYVVPVRWLKTRERGDAVRKPGLFANQNSACQLRNRATLSVLAEDFGLDAPDGTSDAGASG